MTNKDIKEFKKDCDKNGYDSVYLINSEGFFIKLNDNGVTKDYGLAGLFTIKEGIKRATNCRDILLYSTTKKDHNKTVQAKMKELLEALVP